MAVFDWRPMDSAPRDGRFVALRAYFHEDGTEPSVLVPAARYVEGRGWLTMIADTPMHRPEAWSPTLRMFND